MHNEKCKYLKQPRSREWYFTSYFDVPKLTTIDVKCHKSIEDLVNLGFFAWWLFMDLDTKKWKPLEGLVARVLSL